MDQMNVSYKVDESVSWYGNFGKLAVSTDMRVHDSTTSSLPGVCLEMHNTSNGLSKNIHSRTIADNQMVEIIQMATNNSQARQQYLHLVNHNTKNGK